MNLLMLTREECRSRDKNESISIIKHKWVANTILPSFYEVSKSFLVLVSSSLPFLFISLSADPFTMVCVATLSQVLSCTGNSKPTSACACLA